MFLGCFKMCRFRHLTLRYFGNRIVLNPTQSSMIATRHQDGRQSRTRARVVTHSHRRGQEAFMRHGGIYQVFAGMLLGAALAQEDPLALNAHWRKFLCQHGWKERKPPLRTSASAETQFLMSKRACVALSLLPNDQIGAILLALQGLYAHKEIGAGILCVGGQDAFNRAKADLEWLHRIVTIPIWAVGILQFNACQVKRPSIISHHGTS